MMLRDAGATVDEVPTYETIAPRGDLSELRDRLARRAVDLVTFTSSSTVRNFVGLLGADAGPLLAGIARRLHRPDHRRHRPRRRVWTSWCSRATYTIAAFTAAIVRTSGSHG